MLQSPKSNPKLPTKTPPAMTLQGKTPSKRIPQIYSVCSSRSPSSLIMSGTIPMKTFWSKSSQLQPGSKRQTMTRYVTKKFFYQKSKEGIPLNPSKTKPKTSLKILGKPSLHSLWNTSELQRTLCTNWRQDPIKILWTFWNRTKNKSPQ